MEATSYAHRFAARLSAWVMGTTVSKAAKHIHLAFKTLHWLPVSTAIAWGGAFAFNSQTLHVYLSFIENGDVTRAAFGLFAVLALCSLLYAWQSRLSTERMDELYAEHADLDLEHRLCGVRDTKAAISFLLPLLGITAGMWKLWYETAAVESLVARVGEHHASAAELPLIPAGVVQIVSPAVYYSAAGITVLTALCTVSLYLGRRSLGALLRRRAIGIGVVMGLAATGLPFVAKASTVAIATALGPLAMAVLILIAVTVGLIFISRHPGLILLPVATFSLIAGSWRLGEVNGLGTLNEGEPAAGCTMGDCTQPSIAAYFDDWLGARQTKAGLNRKVPVFIVAVEGGGIYAGAAAAKLLTTLQDHCPQFAQHVFAISGVSGGGIGASVFNALNSAALPNQSAEKCAALAKPFTGKQAKDAGAIFRVDHLSGPLAFMIPDVLRKFDLGILNWLAGRTLWLAARLEAALDALSPGGTFACLQVQEPFDRARALEHGFTQAFAAMTAPARPHQPCNQQAHTGLSIGFDRHAGPTSASPSLVLNTTWVERGYRVAFAPFRLRDLDAPVGDGTLYAFADLGAWQTTNGQHPISLIRAAGASARFPGSMPAATIDFIAKGPASIARRWNFVDGGYADGSGATTAFEIFEAIERHAKQENLPVDLRLILLTDAELNLTLADVDGSSFSDSFVVAGALLQVRELLAQRAVTAALNSAAADKPAAEGNDKVMVLRLVDPDIPLPLGWRMSRRMDEVVQYLLGDAAYSEKGCKSAVAKRQATLPKNYERIATTIRSNSCVQRQILELIYASKS